MIIDAHCHIWGKEITTEYATGYLKILGDSPTETLIQDMNEANINKTVLLSADTDVWFKRGGRNAFLPYNKYNDYVAGIVEEHPDRFIGFAGIDPRRGRLAIEELERCVKDLGFSGVKLWQLHGFYPDDPRFYPFYERVQELGVPILCHTGAGPTGTYLKYNRPVYVDTVAVDFPEIKIIMAHIGKPWIDEAIQVTKANPNVYVDISAWEREYLEAPIHLIRTLAKVKMRCGVEKILFGSDWPLFASRISLKEWVDAIKGMRTPQLLQQLGLPDFTEEEKRMILGGNAAKVLGL